MKTLVFNVIGTAILENEDGAVLWASDEDADFAETNPNEFLDEDDAEVIVDYLADIGKVREDEEIDVVVDDGSGDDEAENDDE